MLGLRIALLVLATTTSSLAQTPPCPIGQANCCERNRDCRDDDECNGQEICDQDTGTCLAGESRCQNTGACAVCTYVAAIDDCIVFSANDGTVCSDACTEAGICLAGNCIGTAKVCDDGNPCTVDGCDPSVGCTTTDLPDETPCNDGNPCTNLDGCHNAVCEGRERPDGRPCNDRDPCTTADTCTDGACAGTPRVCDDHDPCTVDACSVDAGGCITTQAPGGTPCDDSNPCTTDDQCSLAGCTGQAVVCPGPVGCRAQGTCDPATGLCSSPPLPDGERCDDGSACTRLDACRDGACLGGDPVVCEARDQCHVPGTCDPATGVCSGPPRPDGEPCNDRDGCTIGDRCANGACAGVPRRCDDGVPCTADSCEDGACRFDPVDARCDRGECALARCLPDDDATDAAGCVRDPVGEGDVCTEDGFTCTDDRCAGGACRHVPVDTRCATADSCNPAVCDPDSAPTTDGCVTVPERAAGVECADDGDPCTDDTCATGSCAHAPVNDKVTCDPVRPAYERAVTLATIARGLATESTGALVTEGIGAQVAGSAGDVATTLEAVARILAGRADGPSGAVALALRGRGVPTGLPETVAQQRARIAFTQVKRTPIEVRAFLQELGVAQQRALVSGVVAGDLRRRGRDLLRGTKALKRDLKRLQTVSRTFTR